MHGDYDIRVEQAEFKVLVSKNIINLSCFSYKVPSIFSHPQEITLIASAESGPLVTLKSGSKTTRSFRPDFVLVRQPPRDGSNDARSLLLGLKYGGVPSINSLHSLYQFQVSL